MVHKLKGRPSNRTLDPNEGSRDSLMIRCSTDEKERWKKTAILEGYLTVTDFVRNRLNQPSS